MKKVLSFLCVIAIVFSLCGCASRESISKKLTKKGYTVTEYGEANVASYSENMTAFDCIGGAVGGFYAVNEENEVVYVWEFEYREDRDIIYREIESQLGIGEVIDVSGNMVVYGSEKGVEDAL